ncbi:DDE family endonuclease [Rhizoctonia solani 123E]|uniref:DDE family endonuclease n=1 Tax=Rhizoctonia solani 123E TaxID=1423351 RepID=A0A074RIE0_9AGAM|nr:DDE family endonuclease [Rhizoctonia solani 123E]
MAPRKKSTVTRLNNIKSRHQAQPPVGQELAPNLESNDSVASSSRVTLEMMPTAYTPESPNILAETLDNLTIGSPQEGNIVFEDPPEDEDDPVDDRNRSSLADPEENESLILPPPDAKEPQDNEDEGSGSINRRQIPQAKAKELLTELSKIIKESFHGYGRHRICTLGDVVLTRLQLMAGTLNFMVESGLKLIDASETAAVAFLRGKWAARQVRKWIRAYQSNGELPTNVYGTWNESVIEDEDLSAAMQEWLREKGKYIQARDVIDFFGTEAAARFSKLIDAPPSMRTAQRWMHRMGYSWKTERRGQFADGHEREDVVDYRIHTYIPKWFELERRMRSWDAEGNEIPPKLAEGERPVVVWFHDESTFYAHDRRLTRWIHESETAGLYKKGEGVSLMAADFISADYGWLRARPSAIPIEGESLKDARVIFRAGKQRDGWFTTSHVVEQLSRALSIVKEQYPNDEHVFVFDNATIHTKLPERAPNVSKMTLGPSKKVGGEEIGPSGEKIKVAYAPAVLPDGKIQQLYYPSNHPIEELRGTFKGLALILKERGVSNAQKLKLVCPSPDSNRPGCLPGSTDCCARRTMMNQPDILAQKSIIQALAESQGCSVLYLPKYHCELNPIEQCWGAAKRVYRDSPTSSSEADLKRNMLSALDTVNLQLIRRFAGRSQRFVHAYSRGLSGSQAAWAMKKYRGHRIIPYALLEEMDKLG